MTKTKKKGNVDRMMLKGGLERMTGGRRKRRREKTARWMREHL